jgi:predicted glycogen debranching enzyme
MGPAAGPRRRRYDALLVAACRPPVGRRLLVNGLEVEARTPAGRFALSTQRYAPDVTHPDGHVRQAAFRREPWPCWTFVLEDGTRLVHELLVPRGLPGVVLRWRLDPAGVTPPPVPVMLHLRPLLSGRDPHALHVENGVFRFATQRLPDGALRWQPYDGVPAVRALHDGAWRDEPLWFRNFQYDVERERGFPCTEDLASPGELSFDLSAGQGALLLLAETPADRSLPQGGARAVVDTLCAEEAARRERLGGPLERAADAYLVRRDAGLSLVAGYPWFADWGRDTFIALRGLLLATGRLVEAGRILAAWAPHVREGLLPNRFVDEGEDPEFNSVDAALWFVIAAREWRQACAARPSALPAAERARVERLLDEATAKILAGYAAGTRHGIRADADGLLACGAPGTQLTWMDARSRGREVTPRAGKPVEVQALWINALLAGARLDARWEALARKARRSFAARFWNEAAECLFDVVDVDHVPGRVDATLRPNQVLAVGGLPEPLLAGPRARAVVDVLERELLVPGALRTLPPGHTDYVPHYLGGPDERDAAYHQGTAWPWLLGPFVEAWLRVRGGTAAARSEARERFLLPARALLDSGGLGHVSELLDAEAPHAPRGAPFQAWSLGELLRLERVVLAEPARGPRRTASRTTRPRVAARS